MTTEPKTVAIAGLGTIGLPAARWLDEGVPGLKLVAASSSSLEKVRELTADFRNPPKPMLNSELASVADIVVEALPPACFLEVAKPAIEQGRTLVIVTLTQLLANYELVDRARETGAHIIGATGALVGFDAVRAAAKGTVHEIVMKTRKPPRGLANAPFVKEQGIDLLSLTEPLCLYRGSVREAAQKFPSNVNVAVALSLAGVGPDRTDYEVWADPTIDRNTHTVVVDADSTHFEMSIANVPSENNPITGKLTPLSVIATLERFVATLTVGS
nr:aspartate dehydrogenase [uncultured Cohaesibacter sp.]